jgi:hypothetical protein
MQPYVIKQGDYLAALADRFDFDADSVWNDDANKDLRDLREDPTMLCATDVLYIPDQVDKVPVTHALTVGSTNSFTTDSSVVTLNVRFASCVCLACGGSGLSGEAYEVEGADLPPGALDGDGCFTATVPTTTTDLLVKLTNRNESYRIRIGYLDPANTQTGAWQRLAMLGFVDTPDLPEDEDDEGLSTELRSALWEFQRSYDLDLTADLDDPTTAKLVEQVGQ